MAKKKADAARTGAKPGPRRKSSKGLTDTVKLGQSNTQLIAHRKSPDIGSDLPTEAREAIELFKTVDEELVGVLNQQAARLQQSLNALAGKTFESKELNDYVARRIQAMCNSLNVRILSPKGRPSLIRWRDYKTTRFGAFELRAQVEGRQKTDYFATRLPPELTLVPIEDA